MSRQMEKEVKAKLIEALDQNDSKATREACIVLKAMSSVDDFLKTYNLGIDSKGFIVSLDSIPFSFDNINQFIADYLGTNDYTKIKEFNQRLKDIRDAKKKEVEIARSHGDFNN